MLSLETIVQYVQWTSKECGVTTPALLTKLNMVRNDICFINFLVVGNGYTIDPESGENLTLTNFTVDTDFACVVF